MKTSRSSGARTARTPGRVGRGRQVEFRDARVRVRAAQDRGVEHPGKLEVGRVDGLARGRARAVDALGRLADGLARPGRPRLDRVLVDHDPLLACSCPRLLSRCGSVLPREDSLLDLRIGAATADVPGHGVPDLVAAGVRVRLDQRRGGDDLAGRAEAALQRVGANEGVRPADGRAGPRSSSPRALRPCGRA